MNIQIDTKNKILKLQEAVNLGEFREILLKLFPKDEWKEYTLETNTTINNWSNPIIVERYRPYDYWPWYNPSPLIYGGDVSGTTSILSAESPSMTPGDGTYNVSIN